MSKSLIIKPILRAQVLAFLITKRVSSQHGVIIVEDIKDKVFQLFLHLAIGIVVETFFSNDLDQYRKVHHQMLLKEELNLFTASHNLEVWFDASNDFLHHFRAAVTILSAKDLQES